MPFANKDKRKKYLKEYYLKNKEKIDRYRRQWAIDNIEKEAEYKSKWLKNNLDKIYEWEKSNHVEGRKAYIKVRIAMKKGILQKQPCIECGKMKVHAHHEDYSKPLDVIWLCPIHHKRLHLSK